MTKGQLAARLGTILEALSLVFAKLSRKERIELEESQVSLRDINRLRHLRLGKLAATA